VKLLTKAIVEKLLKSPIGSLDRDKRPEVIVKYFNPTGTGAWYVTEGEPIESDNGPDWEFFGLADIHEAELGYFRLSELQFFRGRFGLGIERDLHFSNKFLDTSTFPPEVVS
jgi:hypothetical protein